MARTKQSSLSSRQQQYTEGWNTSVPFGENKNENSQQRCGSGNSSRQITPAPEWDLSVSVPEIGRSFQYVTSTGERKNYVIRSYDPVSGLHSVQRITIHDNHHHHHHHSENSYCHSRKHSHKPKEVLLEAMMPKIRWLDEREEEEQEQSPKSIELSRRKKRRAMNALATAESPLSEIARNVSEPEDNDNKEDDKEDDSTKVRDPLLPRKRSRTSYFIGDLPESTPAGLPKQPELVENDLVVSREASQFTLQDASPNDCANASIRVDTEHARMTDVAGYGPDRTEGTTMAVKVRIGNKAWTLPQQLERSDLLAARKRRFHRSKKASATADADADADAEPSTAADSSVSVRGRKGARTMRLNVRVGNGVWGLPQKIKLRNVMVSPKGRPRSMRKKDTTPVAEQTTSEESESQNAFRASKSKTTGSKIGANKTEKIEAKQKTKSQSATASSSIKQKRSNPSISKVGETSLSSVMVRQRVAFEFGNGIYFGTIKTCNTDHSSESKWSWEVLFDDGDLYEFDRDDMRKALAWYERIMNEEAHCWTPAGAELRSLAVGDRIVLDFGSGVYLGSISRCRTEHKFESKWTWELRFDDGEVYNVDAEEMKKSIALSEAIRAWEKKHSPPNIDERKEKVTDGDNELPHSVPPLSSVTTGDRIAYRFSEDNVHFGTVTDCNVLGMKLRPSNASSWTISFDERGIQTFNSNQMKKGLALYETIRAREQNDPKRDEKLQKLESTFLKQKEKVESILPDDVKKRFLKLGFARWEKRYLPVLFLGPYDISPGSVRDQWLNELKKNGGQSVPQIVYWLGSDPSSGFSLLPNKNCISLVKARRKGLVKYKPGNNSGSKTFNNALEELFAALKKPRGEARIPFEKINETHERVCGPKADRLLAEIL
eukprot:CAMPEP_0172391222 /NCGR_PEP_ID=MMETSP1061-20121228/7669_1 /TAXON_ID=37318 /ORGANISM="Pseudo-nitzschia pungens, Strain cf. pungens" /LENGTH=887 /DNA_ID=CAMNT_0013121777 /DNA_START=27 /DNA_END=2690 /DNA_ORIENTATION=+